MTPDAKEAAREQLDAELHQLNAAVDVAVSARKSWMDAHMPDYAEYQVGDVLYNLSTGVQVGAVTRLVRYWGDQNDPRFDRTMEITYVCGRHASTLDRWKYGSREEYIRRCEVNDRDV